MGEGGERETGLWRGGNGSEVGSGACRLAEVVAAGARLVPVCVGVGGEMVMDEASIGED